MPTSIYDPAIMQTMRQAQQAARNKESKNIGSGNQNITIPYPFPSPVDWREHWIYFLLIDRFNNPTLAPLSTTLPGSVAWDQRYDFRQGGTFKGIEQQLDYIVSLGAGAIWLSPVLKNSKPQWPWNYHGYATQDFLTIDARFSSDGTTATAEKELTELIEAAHAKGIYVIMDIVINHTARVFDYISQGSVKESFSDAGVMDNSLGSEPPIEWINGLGFPRTDWIDDLPGGQATEDDAVWPSDLQHKDFFRRRGEKLTDKVPPGGFVRGDFGSMRQLVMEYNASGDEQKALRDLYGKTPVLHVLVTAYQYLIARFDVDGFRIDTVKYVDPNLVETFGNAIREFALSIGKKNFFTFGEVYDDENTIKQFIGRNGNTEGYGIDAALDFPLFFTLPDVAKGRSDVSSIHRVFLDRKKAEEDLLSSHGEAGKYFISFLDNHDQKERFHHPSTPQQQVLLGLTVQFCLQGIPCLYYGTEQGLSGCKDSQGNPDLNSFESVREALWGKTPVAFDKQNLFYRHIAVMGGLRKTEPALLYGRLYFREVSINKRDFGLSEGAGGLIAFSRILSDREVLIVANTNTGNEFRGFVLVDADIARRQKKMKVIYSNQGTNGSGDIEIIPDAQLYEQGRFKSTGKIAVLFVVLAPMEVQVIFPTE